jgi:hypothetical protein
MENFPNNYDPSLYQLVGPIESFYQLVPLREEATNSSTRRAPIIPLQQQQNSRNFDNRALVLFPINPQEQRQQFHLPFPTPQPYLEDPQDDDDGEQFHLALVPVGNYELELFDEVFNHINIIK